MFLKKWNFFKILCNDSYTGSVQDKVLIFDPLPSSGSNSYKKNNSKRETLNDNNTLKNQRNVYLDQK